MDADEDPDWEEEARKAEAEERKRECWRKVGACHRKIQSAPELDIAKQPPGTKLKVITFEEEGNPLAMGPIEFTLLDPASGKVLVKDQRFFVTPTEATLVGCEDMGPVLLRRKLKQLCWLVYEVHGKRFDRKIIPNSISRIEIYKPGMTEPLFVLWEDC